MTAPTAAPDGAPDDQLPPEDPCPTCTGDPHHLDGCRRIDTCGQFQNLDGDWVPFHRLHRLPDQPVVSPDLEAWVGRLVLHLDTEHGLVWP